MRIASTDAARSVPTWAFSDEHRLDLIRRFAGEEETPAPAPARMVKQRRRTTLRPEGSGYTRRCQLWAELKRLAPEKTAKLNCTQLSTEQPEPMVEAARKKK